MNSINIGFKSSLTSKIDFIIESNFDFKDILTFLRFNLKNILLSVTLISIKSRYILPQFQVSNIFSTFNQI